MIGDEEQVALPVTEAQKREVLRRSYAYHANPKDVIPLDEAVSRIDRKLSEAEKTASQSKPS